MPTCTRKLEFDAGHRLMNHESKCAHCHGHRYSAEITCHAESLDHAGRVIDFGKIKEVVGRWIDDNWDHAFIVNEADTVMLNFLQYEKQKHYEFPGEPSAENMAQHLLDTSSDLLGSHKIEVIQVRLYETPNGWADAHYEG